MSERTVFLTDGQRFIGPYLPGDLALARGRRELEAGGATEIHAIDAATLIEAKRKFREFKP